MFGKPLAGSQMQTVRRSYQASVEMADRLDPEQILRHMGEMDQPWVSSARLFGMEIIVSESACLQNCPHGRPTLRWVRSGGVPEEQVVDVNSLSQLSAVAVPGSKPGRRTTDWDHASCASLLNEIETMPDIA